MFRILRSQLSVIALILVISSVRGREKGLRQSGGHVGDDSSYSTFQLTTNIHKHGLDKYGQRSLNDMECFQNHPNRGDANDYDEEEEDDDSYENYRRVSILNYYSVSKVRGANRQDHIFYNIRDVGRPPKTFLPCVQKHEEFSHIKPIMIGDEHEPDRYELAGDWYDDDDDYYF